MVYRLRLTEEERQKLAKAFEAREKEISSEPPNTGVPTETFFQSISDIEIISAEKEYQVPYHKHG